MEFKKTIFNSDECQSLLDIIERMAKKLNIPANNFCNTIEEQKIYQKLEKSGEFYIPEIRHRCFLSSSDKHDLFEYIKKVHPTKDMANDSVKGLLNAIEIKYADVHKKLWEKIITISFIGGTGSGKSMMMKDVLRNLKASGFIIVEINEKEHYIRYFKVDKQKP